MVKKRPDSPFLTCLTFTHFTCPDDAYLAKDEEGGYDYYLNVCDNLSPRHCTTSSGIKSAGVCQQSVKDGPKDKVAGLWTPSEMNLR